MNIDGRKKRAWILKIAITVVVLLFLATSIQVFASRNNIIPVQGRITKLPPTDEPLNMPSFGNTATPDAIQIATNQAGQKNYTPPVKNIVLSKTIDLSPDLPDGQKYRIIVAHADGTYEAIKVGPIIPWYFLDHKEPPDEILAKIKLLPGDKIVDWYSIGFYDVMQGSRPTGTAKSQTTIPSVEATSTAISYP